MGFRLGDIRIFVPKYRKYKHRNVNTLTKTNLPTRRQGVQSIQLKESSSAVIPKVKFSLGDDVKYAVSNINALKSQICHDKQVVEEIQQKQHDKHKAEVQKNYDIILDMMYPNNGQTEVTRKMVTSDKYKESHSTYWQLQLLKYMYSWFLQNYEKLNDYTFDEPTDKDIKIVNTIYTTKQIIFLLNYVDTWYDEI
mgnify:CR=1 FL=1